MPTILVIHGPNLNLLGTREPEVYGKETLKDINSSLSKIAKEAGMNIKFFQSNHEGEIVDAIQEGLKKIDFIILNPGGLTHTSVCIRDALLSTKIPFIEAHLSNIFKREEFRKKSLISDIAVGTITGFGSKSYILAFSAAIDYLKSK
ncbi:MAG: type II 3-dehydroquinate dehydratase [Candidatus Schekmanbacteria bacterium RIFCSPHIGHO2_02_FULL_38_11]|uniref:3-dehydroquinate dehydratase n=1 Tax=Candidatus Schekmanbacteria bacterium RIFCSPLOWO2_12_FULL_38_15 TaxID=1817883 RepID=A0A1F7SKD7_9BACT|nr:MAG: type II 3-dehydroquinate dehydratase [Candidatus Schekmanbacteria bacterium GWA2_38_9]OGL50000.1 MAG: type II 3-dehydroquinate dehydratase [Candidatus Schekmanbacteria bacterium RIFCSPHIGHO2_02_FULL_38_11]OGL51284.1 MAG: type II 3-dehydroquinate dehydratase [Candidatus Schekmanbacteria bacterium RIFCSPLOWO2_02_FULL_38_14]OGL54240.1 MAG: type II 3-dehydroquinate dehydratase [Candidatus Schekmanbacteria bacterium RIFCSPLOWO2_12_FULL_38_15]